MYSFEHKGKYPAEFKSMGEYDLGDALTNPRTTSRIPRGEISLAEEVARAAYLDDYLYLGKGLNNTLPAERVLVYENPDRVVGDICVLFGDGHVEGMDRAAAAALIGIQNADPTHAPEPRDPFDPALLPALDVVQSQLNLRKIANAMFVYANENRGRYPATFGLLHLTQDIDLAPFVSPRGPTVPPAGPLTREQGAAWIDASTDYVYSASRKPNYTPLGDVLVYENPAGMPGGINLLLADGRVEFREMRWALETLRRAKSPDPA
jgi:hypothetical protein